MSEKVSLTVAEIRDLARRVFVANGCDDANADALADTVSRAERDGSHSHGLFRVPGYAAGLKSGKVNGRANPRVEKKTAAVLRLDGDGGYAPLALRRGIPELIRAAQDIGVAAMAAVRTHHFAALWPETEAIAEANLVGIACTAYKPSVAPFGAKGKLFGTNPISFAWPRPGGSPMVVDMATAAMAMGEVQIAARDGRVLPPGTGLDSRGAPTTDPAAVADGGVLLPFGGHKGSAIALMVELLAAGLIGERFSFEAAEADANDGAPPRGGEFLLAISPTLLGGDDWADHCEKFFARFDALQGARLPGSRRHKNRRSDAPRAIDAALLAKIRALI